VVLEEKDLDLVDQVEKDLDLVVQGGKDQDLVVQGGKDQDLVAKEDLVVLKAQEQGLGAQEAWRNVHVLKYLVLQEMAHQDQDKDLGDLDKDQEDQAKGQEGRVKDQEDQVVLVGDLDHQEQLFQVPT